MPRPDIQLSPTYYHDHFNEMADFVAEIYHAHLDTREKNFLFRFRGLSRDGQCLFLRMANRKKDIFHRDDLSYAEIGDITSAIGELLSSGFLRRTGKEDFASLLAGFNKQRLQEIAELHKLTDFRVAWSKRKAVDFLHEFLPFENFAENFDCDDHMVPLHRDDLHFLLYLYFGRLQTNLTSFALRDLGIVSVKSRGKYQMRFHDMAEARGGFFYTKLLKDVKKSGAAALALLAEAAETLPAAVSNMVGDIRDEVIYRLGQFLEKRKESEKAMALYRLSKSFACRERLVRLLHASGAFDQAKSELDAMLEHPDGEEAYIFATDFYERKFGSARTGIFTALLRNSESIVVDDVFRGNPEYAAIRHFENQGWNCHHVENGLWPTLFGLVFWNELFEDGEAFSSAFDSIPQSLKDKIFYRRHENAVSEKLQAARNRQLNATVLETFKYHADEDNGIFYWFDGLQELLTTFLDVAPPAAVAVILEKIAQDFYAYRDGFPDLLAMRGQDVRFIEIKGEGDQLRRNQLARLNMLKSAGFAADICRVAFRVDPDQVYVVIDVETTGGRPPWDRVTEIGAVKIQNGMAIDTWQSLINPDRSIPANITQLTGITNAMVRNAPRFAEIADELEAFLEGAVFVAHNVNFDHGFIASEYNRLEKPFRYPKLCTCSSMRKHYPGHESYSLANLCHVFDIELENHHRALDDAKAAAELLMLVNRKRLLAA